MNNTKKTSTAPKRGGNLAKQLSDLAVPFGLILAKQSLETFLKKKENKAQEKKPQDKKVLPKKANKNTPKSVDKKVKSVKKVSLSGGKGCGAASANSKDVSGFTPNKTQYASV